MALSYIAAGRDLDHGDMGLLFAELDRKLGLLLDGKSPLILLRSGLDLDASTVFGKCFFFCGPNANYAVGRTNYTHAPFVAAAAAAVEVLRDDGLKMMRVSRPANSFFVDAGVDAVEPNVLFAHSLEAHQKIPSGATEPYWLWEELSTVAEKKYRLAVAELVFDDWGSGVIIPAAWNKYNFFRIHNLQTRALEVTFEGGPTLTIPRYGCVAVRRDPAPAGSSVATNYDASLKYFWKHHAGDGRFLKAYAINPGFEGIGKQVYATMPANNVANPAVLFEWIRMFEGLGLFGVRWHRDKHAVYELGTYFDLFGDAAKPGTIIGDLIHHKGPMRFYREGASAVEVQFDGYATLAAKLAAAGLSLQDTGANVAISAPAGAAFNELVAYGTNLLCGGAASSFLPRTSVDVSGAGYAVDARTPQDSLAVDLASVMAVNQPVQAKYFAADGSDVIVTRDQLVLRRTFSDERPQLKIWKDTVAEAVSLRSFGIAETSHCAFGNRRVVLTIFGPQIHFEQAVALSARMDELMANDSAENPFADPMTQYAAGYAVTKRVIEWPPVGWGTETNPGFYSPRFHRKYSQQRTILTGHGYTYAHPDIVNDDFAAEGEDFGLESIGQSYVDSPVTALCPGELETGTAAGIYWPANFGVWRNPDYLLEATVTKGFSAGSFTPAGSYHRTLEPRYMPRVYMLTEIYNTMAASVNALKKARPLNWEHAANYVAPNNVAIAGTDLVPINQYAALDAPVQGVNHTFADLSDLDFDHDHARAEVTVNLGYVLKREEFVDVPLPDSDYYLLTYDYVVGGGGIGPASPVRMEVPRELILGASFAEGFSRFQQFRYLTINSAKAAAEAAGFKFFYHNVSRSLGQAVYGATFPVGVIGHSFTEIYREAWVDAGTPPTVNTPSSQGGLHPLTVEVMAPVYVVFSSEAGTQKWRSAEWSRVIKTDPQAGDKAQIRVDRDVSDPNNPDPEPPAPFVPGIRFPTGGAVTAGSVYWGEYLGPIEGPLIVGQLLVDAAVNKYYVDHTIADAVWAPQSTLMQNYVSAGITVGTKALLIPESSFRHTTSNYSGESYENYQRTQAGGAGYLPLAAVPLADEAAVILPMVNGDKTILARHKAASVYVVEDNYVDLS